MFFPCIWWMSYCLSLPIIMICTVEHFSGKNIENLRPGLLHLFPCIPPCGPGSEGKFGEFVVQLSRRMPDLTAAEAVEWCEEVKGNTITIKEANTSKYQSNYFLPAYSLLPLHQSAFTRKRPSCVWPVSCFTASCLNKCVPEVMFLRSSSVHSQDYFWANMKGPALSEVDLKWVHSTEW